MQGGQTCLMWASGSGHLEVVKYLCEVGGKELVMMTCNVSTLYAYIHVVTSIWFVVTHAQISRRIIMQTVPDEGADQMFADLETMSSLPTLDDFMACLH